MESGIASDTNEKILFWKKKESKSQRTQIGENAVWEKKESEMLYKENEFQGKAIMQVDEFEDKAITGPVSSEK